MHIHDFARFAACMKTLQETFTPDKPITKEKTGLYFKLFSDFSIESFESACFSVLNSKTISIFPTPGEIRAAGSDDMKAKIEMALSKVEKAVDRHGPNCTLIFDDPVIHVVVSRMGGWEWICTRNVEEWKWIRKDFRELYGIYAKQSMLDVPEKLQGVSERLAIAHGYEDSVFKKHLDRMTVRFGDQEKIKKWISYHKAKEIGQKKEIKQLTEKIGG